MLESAQIELDCDLQHKALIELHGVEVSLKEMQYYIYSFCFSCSVEKGEKLYVEDLLRVAPRCGKLHCVCFSL